MFVRDPPRTARVRREDASGAGARGRGAGAELRGAGGQGRPGPRSRCWRCLPAAPRRAPLWHHLSAAPARSLAAAARGGAATSGAIESGRRQIDSAHGFPDPPRHKRPRPAPQPLPARVKGAERRPSAPVASRPGPARSGWALPAAWSGHAASAPQPGAPQRRLLARPHLTTPPGTAPPG